LAGCSRARVIARSRLPAKNSFEWSCALRVVLPLRFECLSPTAQTLHQQLCEIFVFRGTVVCHGRYSVEFFVSVVRLRSWSALSGTKGLVSDADGAMPCFVPGSPEVLKEN
jgi:hypothetical protein